MGAYRNSMKNNSKCEICEKKFSTMQIKFYHLKSVHGEVQKISCNVCNRKFGNKQGLNLHVENSHQEGLKKNQMRFLWKILY